MCSKLDYIHECSIASLAFSPLDIEIPKVVHILKVLEIAEKIWGYCELSIFNIRGRVTCLAELTLIGIVLFIYPFVISWRDKIKIAHGIILLLK